MIVVALIFHGPILKAQDEVRINFESGSFNEDVIADPVTNTPASSLTTGTGIDLNSHFLFANGYSPNTMPYSNGLPVNGQFASSDGHNFQLAPFNEMNDLQLQLTNPAGTLTFSGPDLMSYASFYIIALAANGSQSLNYSINFTDATSTSGSFMVGDWSCSSCTPNGPYGIINLDRVNSAGSSYGGTSFDISQGRKDISSHVSPESNSLKGENYDMIKINRNNITGGHFLSENTSGNNTPETEGYTTAQGDSINARIPVWVRKGVVIRASQTQAAIEPNVIRDSFPVILSGAQSVFKMWYTWADYSTNPVTDQENYAESLDGITWAQYSGNPVITKHHNPYVLKYGGTFYYYAVDSTYEHVDRFTSPDGVSWTLANTNVLGTNKWGTNYYNNSIVIDSGGIYHMVIDGVEGIIKPGYGWFNQGYYRSADGINWTQPVINPVMTGHNITGSFLQKIGSTYYCWIQETQDVFNTLPTDIWRWSSPDMVNWTRNTSIPTFPRRTADEGFQVSTGQVADPALLAVDSSVYLYYSGGAPPNSGPSNGEQIKLAVTNLTFPLLVKTNEGDGSFMLPEYLITLSAADQQKVVTGISFSITGGTDSGTANIFAITGYTPASALPVTLQYFTLSAGNGQALLQWKTSAELNSRKFIIRRASAISPSIFVKVGEVDATSSVGGSVYNFADDPGASGTFFYQLLATDIDGRTQNFGTRSITFNSNTAWAVQDLGSQWKLFCPQPFFFRILDMEGRIIVAATSQGSALIPKPAATGIYELQVETGGIISNKKLIR